MKNKVYYGEYSLKHWIELVLKQNIILPPYQRHFVWSEKNVKDLIKALKEKQFVPPITIGAFNLDSSNQNLVLDGQQRLTSLLIAYLGIFPKEKTYFESELTFANENDDSDDSDEELPNKVLKWTFRALTQLGRNKSEICKSISENQSEKYNLVDFNTDEDFFKKTFLGFSYLVPNTDNEILQQKYYSTVFRNINIQGKALLRQESRASLYFLNKDLEKFFDPNFCNNITVKIVNSVSKVDFVRHLSLLSQYHKEGVSNRIARGYKPQMEDYYEKYIYSMVNNEDSPIFGKFSDIFTIETYRIRFERLEQTLTILEIPLQYDSIISLDVCLFGLIYVIVFKDKEIDITKKDELKTSLNNKISLFRGNSTHAKSPNNLGHLRNRIEQSSAVYKRFSKNLSSNE